jgi:hypothetical protein
MFEFKINNIQEMKKSLLVIIFILITSFGFGQHKYVVKVHGQSGGFEGGTTINGTGFVKANGTTISYDTTSYLSTAIAASQYLTIAGISGGRTIVGGINAGDNLTFSSTSNATKGKIYFSLKSYFDETQNQLNIISNDGTDEVQIGGSNDGRSISARHNGVYANLDFLTPELFVSGGVQLGSPSQSPGAGLYFDGYTPQPNSSYVRQEVDNDGRFRIDINGHEAMKIDSANGFVAIGTGLDSATSTLETQSFAPGYREVAATTSLTSLDCVLMCCCNSSGFTVSLPDCSNIKIPGRHYTIINNTSGIITITPFGTNTINGSNASIILAAPTGTVYKYLHLVAGQNSWFIIGSN